MEVHLSYSKGEGEERVIALVRDIHQRKLAEAAILESERRFKDVFDSSPMGIYVREIDKRYLSIVNPAFEDMSGYSNEELTNPSFTIENLLSDVSRTSAETHLRQVDQKQQIAPSSEYEAVRKDGQRIFVELYRSTITWQGRDAVLGFVIDVTNERRIEEHLRQSQKMEAIGRLAGGVAHDFNNLLTVIGGNLDIMEAKTIEGEPIDFEIKQLTAAFSKASNLTNQLLTFSRKQVVQPRIIDINAELRQMENMLHRLIGEDIQIHMNYELNLHPVRMDPAQLDQIVINMVVNSRAAMPQGGKITISTANISLDTNAALLYTDASPGKYVQLSISDTGQGMDEATRSRVFEPFFTTKQSEKGTGLGLATVYGIVRQSDGFITVYSEPGEGTVFKVYIPKSEQEEAVDPDDPKSGEIFGSETILVVEDEENVRSIIQRTLEIYGYTILEAASGTQGLELFRQQAEKIDMILTDVVMPEMSGRELVEKASEIKPGIRILYMSGYTDDAIVRHGILETGMSFINKPFQAIDLLQKIRSILSE